MDAALRKALRSAQKAHSGCDAELAAAYTEGRLKGVERRRFEGHLAECAACRGLTTAMLEELHPETVPPVPAPAWSFLRWRWAVPAMAGVLIVGSAVYFERQDIAPPAATVTPVAAPAQEPAPAAAFESPARAARNRRDEVAEREKAGVETLADRRLQKEEQVAVAQAPAAVAADLADANKAKNVSELRESDELRKAVATKPAGVVVGAAAETPSQASKAKSVSESRGSDEPKRAVASKSGVVVGAVAGAPSQASKAKNVGEPRESDELKKAVTSKSAGVVVGAVASRGSELKKGGDLGAVAEPPRQSDDLQKAAAKPAGVVGGAAGESSQSFAGSRRQQLQQFREGAAQPPFTLPDGAPLRALARSGNRIWAVSDGGRIYRSLDAGVTWEKLPSPTQNDLVSVDLESETSLMVVDKAGNRYKARP